RFITDSRPLPSSSPTSSAPTLQAIGAGLPRAATSSLQAALEHLGYTPCLHMAHIIPHPKVSRLLLNAMREKDTARRQKMVKELHEGYAAVTDFSAVCFVEDLMDLYPEAKVVLNGRPDPGVWARSAGDSFGFFFSWRFRATGLLWTTDRIWYGLNAEAVRWMKAKFGVEDIFSEESYERYYEYVRTEARKRGREVLEFKAEDGWVPLCRFLGKDVPKDKEFPRLNERRDVEVIKRILIVRGLLTWAAL
ncbi:hypothetical protein CONLIGDRAFT_554094, partial [Coniochaeta ligniaria NRRL 30616]